MLNKSNTFLLEINQDVSSFLNLNPLCIKDSFFPIKNLISLMDGIKPNLANLTSKNLCEIYNKAFTLKILDLDYSFIKAIREALILKNDLSRKDLSSILKLVFLSQQTRSRKDREFITEIADQLLKTEGEYRANDLIDNMWILSKLNYYDDSLFYKNNSLLLREIPTLTHTRLVKLAQSLATFNLFDHDIIDAISDAYNTIIRSNDIKAKVNFSYYLSMILMNNENLVDDNLNSKIRTAVNTIINRDTYTQNNIIEQVSILNMHCARIIELPAYIAHSYTNKIKESKDVTTSTIQTEVFKLLKKTYDPNDIDIEMEKFDIRTASFKDISFHDKAYGYTLYIEVDGPDHFFINKTDMKNGQTAFRDALHQFSHGRPIITADYNSFDDHLAEETLYQINSIMGILRAKRSNIKSESKITIPENIETKADHRKAPSTEDPKKSKKKKKQDFNSIIQEYKQEESPVESNELNQKSYKELLKKHKVKTDSDLLVKLFVDNLNDAKRLLDYIQKTKPTFFNDNANSLIQNTLDNIQSHNNETKNRALLEGCNLWLNYLPAAEFNQSHIKGLMFSLKYGKLNLLKRLLNLIPETETKKDFILAFFIASCSFDNITTLNLLLTTYNIDVNESCDNSIVSALLNLFDNTNAHIQATNEQNTQKLHAALMSGNELPKLISTSNTAEGKMTGLASAVYNKRTEIVEFLFTNGAVQNYTPDQDGSDRDLLMTSLLISSPDIATLIIKNSIINPNLHDSYGFSYLHIALLKIKGLRDPISERFIKIVELLIDLGADPNKEIVKDYNVSPQPSSQLTKISKYMTPLWIAAFYPETNMLLNLANKHTNFIKPVETYYKYGRNLQSSYISLLEAIKSYGGDTLIKALIDKLHIQLRNQTTVSSYMPKFLPEFREDNQKWVRRNIFLLDEFKSITWDGTAEETLEKFKSAMKSIPWLSDEGIVSFLSDNIDTFVKESNFVKSKEEALNKISKCVYKEQIEAVLLHGFNPENLTSHDISHPEQGKRIQALNLIKDSWIVKEAALSSTAWCISHPVEQNTLEIIISYTTAAHNLTLFNAPYTFSPEIRTWGSINYQIDALDLHTNQWIDRTIVTNNNLNYESLPNMDFKAL